MSVIAFTGGDNTDAWNEMIEKLSTDAAAAYLQDCRYRNMDSWVKKQDQVFWLLVIMLILWFCVIVFLFIFF